MTWGSLRRAMTLLEMIVTLVVLSIVAAIGFIGLNAISDRQAESRIESDLQAVIELERRFAVLNDDYTTDPEELGNPPAGLSITSGPVTSTGKVSIAVGVEGTLAVAALSPSGSCLAVRVPPLYGPAAKTAQQKLEIGTKAVCDPQGALPAGEWAQPAGAPGDAALLLSAGSHASGQTWFNEGSTSSSLDAQLGSSLAEDAQDPLFLSHAGQTYAYIPANIGNFVETPDSDALSFTGSFDIQIQVALDDWSTSSQTAFVSRWASGQQSYWFGMTGSGQGQRLSLSLSSNGSSSQSAASSVPVPAFAPGQQQWLRVVWDQSIQSASFYYGPDGANWSQLGPAQNITVPAVFNGTAPTQVGNVSGTSLTLGGKLFKLRIRNAAGTMVASLDTSACTQTSCAASTGENWSVQRSESGKRTAVVDRPMFLIGDGDFVQIPDNVALDFTPGEDATVVLAGRFHGSVTSGDPQLVSKRSTSSTSACSTGWSISLAASASTQAKVVFAQSGCSPAPSSFTADTSKATAVGFVRSQSGAKLEAFSGASVAAVQQTQLMRTDAAIVDTSNALPVRIGVVANGVSEPSSFELFGIAVYERALTAQEIAAVATRLGV